MNNHFGQTLLIFALALFILYVVRLRTILTDRLIFIIGGILGVALVIDPNTSTWVANRLGIGRGTDLVFYLFIVAGLFFAVTMISENNRLQRRQTRIIQQMALDNPKQGPVEVGSEPAPSSDLTPHH
ncbi:MAG: DUF2304 domain-containing protein [Chloroflexi bacterium]|nr:DUF2304 domain-containing protein [Chloroflexota bacterium]